MAMNKRTILALACAAMLCQGASAQSKEVTYTEDPGQGYLMNRFKDNWFITGEGGADIYFSRTDNHRYKWDRFAPAASIYVGKWFSPIIGLRAGISYLDTKGLGATANSYGLVWNGIDGPETYKNCYKTNIAHWGAVGDVMLNITNWWCGYKPGRIYNFSAYTGSGYYHSDVQAFDENGRHGWKNGHDKSLAWRGGIINSFNVSKQVQLSLDIRYTAIAGHKDGYADPAGRTTSDLAAFIGVTYNFKKRNWSAPVVPVYPEPENCDALRTRLAAADNHIADLEQQLRQCLSRPVEKAECEEGPVATIYFPIGVSRLSRIDNNVLKALGEAMKNEPSQKYVITGWADNYTGTDAINQRLRMNRAEAVKKALVRAGVNEDQLETTTDNGNLAGPGEKFVSLDRAVTINKK